MSYIAERRQEERERRRGEILDAAETVTTTAGWEQLTMEQVARNARLSRALVYVYFKDKTDLMFGICERGLATLKQRFDSAVGRHKRGLDQMVAVGRAYIAFAGEFPVYFDIIARCELRSADASEMQENEQSCHAAGHAVRALMVRVLEAGVRDGSIRPDVGDLPAVATILWGFTHGVIQVAATKGQLLADDGLDSRSLMDPAIVMATRAIAAGGI